MKYSDLTVILPTLDEEGNIGRLIERLRFCLPGVFIIVVDDNSKDETVSIAKHLAKGKGDVRVLERKGKACLTKSIEAGVHCAKTDYVAWMDADFSHPPEMIEKLYAAAKLSGCSIASRFIKNKKRSSKKVNQNDTPLATILSYILNFFVYHILRLKITDYTSGFIVLKKDLIKKHNFVGDYGEYFIELMYFLDRRGVEIKELYYISPKRKWGESKTGTNLFKLTKRGIKYLWLIVRLTWPWSKFKRVGR